MKILSVNLSLNTVLKDQDISEKKNILFILFSYLQETCFFSEKTYFKVLSVIQDKVITTTTLNILKIKIFYSRARDYINEGKKIYIYGSCLN